MFSMAKHVRDIVALVGEGTSQLQRSSRQNLETQAPSLRLRARGNRSDVENEWRSQKVAGRLYRICRQGGPGQWSGQWLGQAPYRGLGPKRHGSGTDANSDATRHVGDKKLGLGILHFAPPHLPQMDLPAPLDLSFFQRPESLIILAILTQTRDPPDYIPTMTS